MKSNSRFITIEKLFMSIKNIFIVNSLVAALFLSACKQSDPTLPVTVEEKGDLYFSGYYWNFKNSNGTQMGPGPNYFASTAQNIWLDADSMLHLRITKNNNTWFCSEIISVKEFGYGTYIFTTASDLTVLNEKTILGLFTWNSYSFQTQANSEVDIEFARWNNANDSLLLTYSVQPVWFDNPTPYIERSRRPQMQVGKLKGHCTHMFRWTPELITWETYEGDNYPGTNLLASWSFNNTNLPRRKLEGGLVSNPVVIPAPEDSTNVRFNMWLLNGQAPSNNQEQEIVIKSFKYIPL